MRYPASPGGRRAVDQWLTSQPGGGSLVDAVAHAPVLTHESFVHGPDEVRELWGSGAWVSWWGGPAVDTGEPWPSAADGAPLDHVVTVHLDELHGAVDPRDRPAWGAALQGGLPEHGALELFLDRREPATPQRPLGSARLRWVESPTTALLEPPGDTRPSDALCGLWLPGFTVPAPADLEDPATAKAARTVWDAFDAAWGTPTFAYGHSRRGRGQVEDVLRDTLGADEDLRLVLSLVPPVTGLLPPGRAVEVWLRHGDLADDRSDRAVCLLRDV